MASKACEEAWAELESYIAFSKKAEVRIAFQRGWTAATERAAGKMEQERKKKQECGVCDPLSSGECACRIAGVVQERERAAGIAENMDYIKPNESSDIQSYQIQVGNTIAAAIREEK